MQTAMSSSQADLFPRSDQTCRYAGGGGHVESYFLRANHPTRPLAIWLKATILAPLGGEPVAEAWCIWLDGEKNRTFAHRETVPLRQAVFLSRQDGSLQATVGACRFRLGSHGSATGNMERNGVPVAWDLQFEAMPGAVAAPLCIFPLRAMVDGPFPRSKLLTPFPQLLFSGTFTVDGNAVDLSGWQGMQGHNWGREHAFEYAWGQCLFSAPDGQDVMVEGFTGRIKLAGRPSPRLSAMVVRHGSTEYRFDRVMDLWRQDADIGPRHWTLKMRGADGSAVLSMDAAGRPLACLGYRNPDGRLSYCINSKLARVELRVEPAHGPVLECHSPHGGALEFLRTEADPDLGDVV